MKNWLFLATAIIFEVSATSALKSSEGFTRLVPSFIVVAGYAAAFYSYPLKPMNIQAPFTFSSGYPLGFWRCVLLRLRAAGVFKIFLLLVKVLP